jgi:hypothetical protein
MILPCPAKPLLLTAAILLALGLFGCGEKKPAEQKPIPPTSDLSRLVEYYQRMKRFGMEGKVVEFQALRDSVTKVRVDYFLSTHGGVIDSARVATWAYTWPNIEGLPLMQDTSDGEWRRLTFYIEGLKDKNGVEKMTYPVVIYRKNGNVWRVSNSSLLGSDKMDKDGRPILLSQLTYHKMFRIPPDFEDLLKPPEVNTRPKPQPVQIQTPPR